MQQTRGFGVEIGGVEYEEVKHQTNYVKVARNITRGCDVDGARWRTCKACEKGNRWTGEA